MIGLLLLLLQVFIIIFHSDVRFAPLVNAFKTHVSYYYFPYFNSVFFSIFTVAVKRFEPFGKALYKYVYVCIYSCFPVDYLTKHYFSSRHMGNSIPVYRLIFTGKLPFLLTMIPRRKQ